MIATVSTVSTATTARKPKNQHSRAPPKPVGSCEPFKAFHSTHRKPQTWKVDLRRLDLEVTSPSIYE
jgi:hypothetical protein